ncbi:MAG: TetR/AcrR family transcriptional regulator [Phenylobacterium sp.]|uniref:TetR/AcrR family transcriptional regulator n=1 Tax=Phenylobacterium sp. TaxID=1871053 RepID=UPI00391F3BF0
MVPLPTRRRRPEATRAALLEAARLEFEEPGYDATHTNRIAARAGFAPQTFYRHFRDKPAIFLAVYRRWAESELDLLEGVQDAAGAAAVLIASHRASLNFRRALRVLSLTDPAMRAARAESRRLQIARLTERLPHLSSRSFDRLAAELLALERLADACAEGEFQDLGIAEEVAAARLADAIRRTFGP